VKENVSSNAKESAKQNESLSVKKNNAMSTRAGTARLTLGAMTAIKKKTMIVGIELTVPIGAIAETDLIARPLLQAVRMPFL
jgi:hypothetical protein